MQKNSSKFSLKRKIRKSRKSRKSKRQKAGANIQEKQSQYKLIWKSIKNNKKPLSEAKSLNNLKKLTKIYNLLKEKYKYDLFDIIFENQKDITKIKIMEPSMYFDHKHGTIRMTAGIKGLHIYVAFKKNNDNKLIYKILGVISNNY
jgi:hypothetical protein